jgi:peptide/nickel transport system permease protein
MFMRRVGLALLQMLAATALTFWLVTAALGNVAALIAERAAGAGADGEMIAKIADDLGLNDPLPVRYARWLGDARGGVLALLLSLVMGIAGAASNGGIVDRLLHGMALVGASTPNFFVAAMLVIVFSVWLGLVPTFGVPGLTSWLLPWITIVLFPASVLARVVRVNLQDTISRPFATTGFAKGLTRRAVLLREALPNIAIPYMTTFGAQFTLMIIGAIVVERVFGLNGVGACIIEAIRFRDFIGMQAILTLFVVFFVSINLLVDLLAMLADPRLRRPRKA